MNILVSWNTSSRRVIYPNWSLSRRLPWSKTSRWEKVEDAISALPSGKAAGDDTIPMEFYKVFREVLAPEFLNLHM